MPASEVMPKFKAGKLHSGSPNGPIVTNPAQARAIAASEEKAAKEGKSEYQVSSSSRNVGESDNGCKSFSPL